MTGFHSIKRRPRFALILLLSWLGAGLVAPALSQSTGNTVGLTYTSPSVSPGYTLFAPGGSRNTYLIDLQGRLIQRWTSTYFPGMAAYLLEDGHLLRSARVASANFQGGGTGGRVEEYDWAGNLVWSYTYSTTQHRQHHDSIKLPNGNVIMIAWELKSREEALAAGRNPALLSQGQLWPDSLIEIQPSGIDTGTIVWEWHAWDHLIQDLSPTNANFGVVADHPERIDINFPGSSNADWLHCNGIDYNADLDQIVVSVHGFDEIWILDHSTTTAEAAGHSGGRSGRGGDLLYRWGNPQSYRAGTSQNQKLFGQHNPNWIPEGYEGAGNILVFNNGAGRPEGRISTIEEITPPLDANGAYTNAPGNAFGPADATWQYTASIPTSFYAQNVSGAQRLPNGNTLICKGPAGVFFEVTALGETVWEYVCPVTGSGLLVQGSPPPLANLVFRSPRYAPDFAGLTGRDLTPQGTAEPVVGIPFRLTQASPESMGLRIQWNSEADRVYQVLYRSDIPGSDWTTIGTLTAIGTSAWFIDSDEVRLQRPQGFYRVQESP